MRLGLVAYSFKAAWCDAYTLMDRAAAAGLRGVEFPVEQCLPGAGAEELARARATPQVPQQASAVSRMGVWVR